VAAVDSAEAGLARAQADYDRSARLHPSGAASAEEVEHRAQVLRTAQSDLEAALQGVYQVRASLGLPAKPPTGDDLAQVPPDLDQTFSKVREAQAKLIQTMAELGVTISFNKSPTPMIAHFYTPDAPAAIPR